MPVRLSRPLMALLITQLAIFVIQQSGEQFFGFNLSQIFGLVPARFVFDFYFWQLFSYAFLHGDVTHLILNLLMLAFIGSEIQMAWGVRRFFAYYLVCVAAAGVFYLALQILISHGLYTPMIGASGAVYGLLIAYGLMFGERTLLFMLLFPMKAKHFIWVLVGVELMTTLFSPRGGLSAVAHLGGMVGGFAYLWFRAHIKYRMQAKAVFSRLKKPGRKKRGPSHLKLVSNNLEEFDRENSGSAGTDPKRWH